MREVEAASKELKAQRELTAAQKMEAQTGKYLANPSVEFESLWGGAERIRNSELTVMQAFDFPSAYASRNKIAKLRSSYYDMEGAALRQQLLLDAKTLCIQIVHLNRMKEFLSERVVNAERLDSAYRRKFAIGEANILECNKIALIKDKRYPGLFLLPAAQTRDKNAVSPEQMKKLCQNIRDMGFEYIIIDCPAGIEQGFKNAIAGADRAVVVTTPEVSAVRDADRIIGLLEANGLNNPGLIVNRIKMDMVKRGDMMSVEDVKEILSVDVLGVVPDDEAVVVTTNRGEPAVADDTTRVGKAYRNITSRILGEDVPLMSLDENEGFFGKIKKMFAR